MKTVNHAPIVCKTETELIQKYNSKLVEILNVKPTRSKKIHVTDAKEWLTPHIVLLFLENTIKHHMGLLIQDPETSKQKKMDQEAKPPTLLAWEVYKLEIVKVLDHRIQHTQELTGSVNTSHITMAEHLLLYFIEKFKTRQTAEL